MKNILILLTVLLNSFDVWAQVQDQTKEKESFIRWSVYFSSAKHELNDNESKRINDFLDTLNIEQVKSVFLRGFTDSDADSLYNIKLSDRRVATVQGLFEETGINEKIIKRSYYGENMAGRDSASENLKSRNRRVEIVVVFKPIPKPLPAPKDTCKMGDTLLVLKNGTILKGSICDLNDSSDLEIIEALSIEDIMAQSLQTMGNNENQLVSGGMISIRSKSGNCNFNKPVTIYIPITDSCADAKRMSFFNSSDGQNGRTWSPVNGIKIKIVNRNGTSYYEIVATKCAKMNLDFIVKPPLDTKTTLIESKVSGYTLKRIDMYNDCPRFYWSFKKKISANKMSIRVMNMSKPPQIRFLLVNNENRKDTILTPFMSVSELKHGKFKGFSGQYEDRTQRWIIFKKREMNLYPWYQLQNKHVIKD